MDLPDFEKKEIYCAIENYMSRKNTYLILLAAVLAVIASVFIFTNKEVNQTASIDPLIKDRDFGYKDIEKLTTIVINRKKYPLLVFKKEGNSAWILNDKFPVNEATMPHLLATLKGLKMKYIPPKSMLETIKKDLEMDGIEVKLFVGNDLVKHYTIGTEFGDGSDTPFVMMGSNQPFMMQLPGLNGSVRRRFIFDIDDWKSKTIFKEDPAMIKKITVAYPNDVNSGFSLIHQTDDFSILDANGKAPDRKMNKNTISSYFDFFTELVGESNESENPERKNILKREPFCVITIVMEDNSLKEYVMHSMSNILGDHIVTGPRDIHPDNKYFVLMPNQQLILAQQRVIGKVIRPYWYFF